CSIRMRPKSGLRAGARRRPGILRDDNDRPADLVERHDNDLLNVDLTKLLADCHSRAMIVVGVSLRIRVAANVAHLPLSETPRPVHHWRLTGIRAAGSILYELLALRNPRIFDGLRVNLRAATI